MSPERRDKSGLLSVLAIAGPAVVVLSALAVEAFGGIAVGALLGVLVVLAALGLRQQARYARRSAADFAAISGALTSLDRRAAKVTKNLAELSKVVTAQSRSVSTMSKDVSALSTTVTKWSKDVKVAEIETGIAALNRYVALGSDTAHEA
jgi:uncharacterized coiled-coil protein SlyX